MEISAQLVKQLRDRTGAGVMDCRKALTASGGDLGRAEAILKEKGMQGPKDPTRETKQGLVQSYVHTNGTLGALVELNCETDFVARTDDFKQLAYEIALHVAALNPLYSERSAIPEQDLATRRAELEEQVRATGTPEEQVSAAVDDRLERWIEEVTLLEQQYVRDPKLSIRQLIASVGAKTGENIRIGRYARFKVGE
jgi:elongation factor Ts